MRLLFSYSNFNSTFSSSVLIFGKVSVELRDNELFKKFLIKYRQCLF